ESDRPGRLVAAMLPAEFVDSTFEASIQTKVSAVERKNLTIGDGAVEPSRQFDKDMANAILFERVCCFPVADEVKSPVFNFPSRGNIGGDLNASQPFQGMNNQIIPVLPGASVG